MNLELWASIDINITLNGLTVSASFFFSASQVSLIIVPLSLPQGPEYEELDDREEYVEEDSFTNGFSDVFEPHWSEVFVPSIEVRQPMLF